MCNFKLIIAALVVVGTHVSAFWRMECRGVSGQARVDPLVDYGVAASHAHNIFGSGGFSPTADYDALVASNCTSCAVTQDKSAYWAPLPYFLDNSTGKYEAVANVGGMLAYYFLNKAPSGDTSIKAFPQGFRMIAGTTNRRNYTVGDSSFEDPDPAKSLWASLNQTSQDDLAQRAIGFNCLDYTKTAEGSLYRHFMPSKDYIDAYCPDGIRFELMFPSCWDGVNLDSDDHKSHVAYPNLVIDGNCPDGFPTRLPGLFYETIWDMGTYTDRSGMFAISNGDPLGFGYHGDFIMGWEETDSFSLQDAVDTCTNLDGEIESCPLFTIISDAQQQECRINVPSILAKEDVVGPLSSLPGDVELTWGPAPADAANFAPDDVTSTAISDLSYAAGSTASVSGSYVPGNIFKATPVTVTDAATTTAPTPTAADDPMITLYTSTFTYTDGVGSVTISEIVYEEAITWVTEMTTTTVYIQPTPDLVARRNAPAHAHKHRHARGHRH